MTKKTIGLIVLTIAAMLLLLPVLSACNNSETGGTDRLVVYNWEDYLDKSLIPEFEEYYKEVTGRTLKLTYTTYDTNETMMTKVLKGDANVDLICPSEYSIERLLLADCLMSHKQILGEIQPQLERYGISLNNISSIGGGDCNIDSDVMDAVRSLFSALTANGKTYDMTEYMVPYMWGTLGILYNTSVVSLEELEEYGWGVLWNVQGNEKLEGKILMKDSVRDSYACAVMYLREMYLKGESGYLPQGYENYSVQDLINCTDDVMLAAAERVLTEQREHISGYEVDFGKDDMINEIVYADLAWSGDALYAIEEGDYDKETDTYQLGYYLPVTSGSNIWYDGWAIPTSVNNKLAAMMFIDYMCSPLSGIRNSMEIGYTSAVSKNVFQNDEDVLAFIEENEYDIDEYFGDEARYPEITEALGVMRDYGARNDLSVQMWQRAKSGGIVFELFYVIAGFAAAAGLAAGIYFLAGAFSRRPRKIKNKADAR